MEEHRQQICGIKAGFQSGSDSTKKRALRRGPLRWVMGVGRRLSETIGRGPSPSGGGEGGPQRGVRCQQHSGGWE